MSHIFKSLDGHTSICFESSLPENHPSLTTFLLRLPVLSYCLIHRWDFIMAPRSLTAKDIVMEPIPDLRVSKYHTDSD